MAEVVEMCVLDASRLPSLPPVPLEVHEPQFAAVGPTKETGRRQHRPRGFEVVAESLDRWLGKMHDSSAAHLRFDNHRPVAADLDDLPVNRESAGVEVDVAALKSEDLADAQVRPERKQHGRVEACRHRGSSSL